MVEHGIVRSPPTSPNPDRGIQEPRIIVSPTLGQNAVVNSIATTSLNSTSLLQQSGGGEVSPRRERKINQKAAPDMRDNSSKRQHDSSSTRISVVTPERIPSEETRMKKCSQEQGMGRFGMLDEFGRSVSNRRLRKHDAGDTLIQSATKKSALTTRDASQASGSNGMNFLFRRKSVDHQQPHGQQHHQNKTKTRQSAPPTLEVHHNQGGTASGCLQPSRGKIHEPSLHDTEMLKNSGTSGRSVPRGKVTQSSSVEVDRPLGSQRSTEKMARSPHKKPQRGSGDQRHHQRQRHQSQQNQFRSRGKSNVENSEASSRAQSYFQRIKKTLQQEI